MSPGLLVLDEPTSVPDVSVQVQILNLLQDIKAELGPSMLFVIHNLKVVAHVSDGILVMPRGVVVEARPAEQVMRAPAQAYTCALMGFGRQTRAGHSGPP